MKRTIHCLTTIAFGIALTLPSFAGAMDHSSMGGMDHGAMGKDKGTQGTSGGKAAQMPRRGKKIRDTKVDGYQLEYYFMDMAEMMDGMKAMGMKMNDMDMSKMKTHHVMVFITRTDGKLVEDAKVGYKIDGPGGEQKTMAGAMMGGFGADADFKSNGTYKFTMKAVAEQKTLVDDFTYNVK